MPKAYVIVTEKIKDEAGMAEYIKVATPTLANAKLLAFDGAPEVLEGEWHGPQTVLIEFESVEAAKAWYDSEEYKAARPLRWAAAECTMAIITGA